jgi:hypothetical protein
MISDGAAREFLLSSRMTESLSDEEIDRLVNALLSVQFGNNDDNPLVIAALLDHLGNVRTLDGIWSCVYSSKVNIDANNPMTLSASEKSFELEHSSRVANK